MKRSNIFRFRIKLMLTPKKQYLCKRIFMSLRKKIKKRLPIFGRKIRQEEQNEAKANKLLEPLTPMLHQAMLHVNFQERGHSSPYILRALYKNIRLLFMKGSSDPMWVLRDCIFDSQFISSSI